MGDHLQSGTENCRMQIKKKNSRFAMTKCRPIKMRLSDIASHYFPRHVSDAREWLLLRSNGKWHTHIIDTIVPALLRPKIEQYEIKLQFGHKKQKKENTRGQRASFKRIENECIDDCIETGDRWLSEAHVTYETGTYSKSLVRLVCKRKNREPVTRISTTEESARPSVNSHCIDEFWISEIIHQLRPAMTNIEF